MQPFHRALGGVKGLVKGLALAALVVVPVTAATVVSADRDTPRGSITSALAGDLVVPAAAPQRCHGSGAIIRTPRGRLREVSLTRGLLTYEHKAPGSFVRLCVSAAPADPTPQGS